MAVNPNIALAVKPLEVPDPINAMLQATQLQQAQMQMDAYRRAQEKDIARTNALAQAGSDDTAIANALLKAGDLKGYSDFVKTRRETMKADTELVDAKLKQSRSFLDTLDPMDPNAPQQYLAWHQANHTDPVLGPVLKARGITAEQSMARINDAITKGPQAFAQLIAQSKLGTEKFMELNKPQLSTKDTGGQLIDRVFEPLTQKITNLSTTTKTMTPGEVASTRIAQGQLANAQDRLAWEKANPGYEIKEGEDGTMYGVNKRTLQATPITVNAAPVAAPVAAPGAALAASEPRVPQTTAAPATSPQPLKGKGTSLTESQGNATAFGMRMTESNKLLNELEKGGTTSGGRIKGAVQGTLTALVPYQGERLAEGAGSVMNAVPGFLGGPNEAQQSYAQAKENFITAVLRKESGAAIGADEFAREDRKYFPQVGDSEKNIKQKQRARELAIEAMKVQAGPGAKSIGNAGALPNASANDPLGLGIR